MQASVSTRAAGAPRPAASISRRALAPVRPPTRLVRTEARSDSTEGFITGFVLGGVIFGALGYLLAPTLNRALVGEAPRFYDEPEDRDPGQKDLLDKVAKLNASIDEVASRLGGNEPEIATQANTLGSDLKKLFQMPSQ